MVRQFVTGGLVMTSVRPPHAAFATVVIEDGLIIDVLTDDDGAAHGSRDVHDARGCVVLPGLVNAHVHSGVALLRGMCDDLSLLEMNECGELTAALDLLARDESAQALCCEATYLECLSTGSTFVCDLPLRSLGDTIVRAFRNVGIRGAVIEHADMGQPYLNEQVARLRAASLVPQLWLHSEAKTRQSSNFHRNGTGRVRDLADQYNVGTHMHFAETSWRLDALQAAHHTRSTASVLHTWGHLRPGFVGAHAVHVSAGDIALLTATGAGVVACPSSEMKLGHGVAPVPAMLRADVTIGLGTDGAIYNNSNDLFAEMRTLTQLHRLTGGPSALTAGDALHMATEGGAALFGLANEAGRLAPGYRADLVILDAATFRLQPLLPGQHAATAANIVNNAVGDRVRTVIVDGQRIWHDGRHAHIDVSAIWQRLREAAYDLLHPAGVHSPARATGPAS